MTGRLSFLLFVPLFLLCSFQGFAADNSYFAHKQFFYLCSIKKECTFCESCQQEAYLIKIKNNTDKKIKSVFYQYYSPLNQKVYTREADVHGDEIQKQGTGMVKICVKDKLHWIISRIVYDDGSMENFLVDGPLNKYHQEADECDCNFTPKEKKY